MTTRLWVATLVLAGACAAGVFGVMTQFGAYHWQDSVALFGRAVAVTEHNALAHWKYGDALGVREQHRAAEQYRAVLEIHPGLAGVHRNLATALANDGRWAEAADSMRSAAELAPQVAEHRVLLGHLLLRQGRRIEAIEQYHQALAIDPSEPQAGQALERLGVAPMAPISPVRP